MTKRLLLPDLLKGLAAFFMVQVHITELFIDPQGRESSFGKVTMFLGGPFAAIIFMIVMGYFVYKNKSTTWQNVARGTRLFALGLLLNIGLNFNLLLKIIFEGWQYNPFEYIFGVDILFLAGMSIVILAFIKSIKKWQLETTLAIFLCVLFFSGFMTKEFTADNHFYILPYLAGGYSWSYFPLFPWLAYPLAGFMFAQNENRIRLLITQSKVLYRVCLTLIAAFLIIFFQQGINTTINLPEYYHHALWYIIWAIGLSVFWILFIDFIINLFPSTIAGNFLIWIGKNITLFYVIQWLIIGNIATVMYQSQSMNKFVYWFAGVFTASVSLTYAVIFIRSWIKGRYNIKA